MFEINSPSIKQDLIKSEVIYKQISKSKIIIINHYIWEKFKRIKSSWKSCQSWGYILKPFSRKYTVAVKRNARKIGKSHRKYQKIM
jgi:predicted metallo-beta-lactamase superfamily hydrolase